MRVLLAEPDASTLSALRVAIGTFAEVDACDSLPQARELLFLTPYDRLIVNHRLQAYNGLHLVHLAPLATRSIVYTDRYDHSVSRDVREAGAFYEVRDRLSYVVPRYIRYGLPKRDRRELLDRRSIYRGGRRSSDLPAFAHA